jgi:hypothetical protein
MRVTLRLIHLILAVGLAACAPKAPPRLLIDTSVDRDFSLLAQTTWGQFLEAFRAQTNCFGDVHLRAVYDLDSRAAYDPPTATVTVRVPGSAAMLSSALVHEWAHHVEFQCPAHEELRAAFLAAQELPSQTEWRPEGIPANTPESLWAEIPSEQYAEAAIAVVFGRRQVPTTVRVTPEAVSVLALWAAGECLPCSRIYW